MSRSQRDTIDAYIDLWEQLKTSAPPIPTFTPADDPLSPAESAPPTPPPKDDAYKPNVALKPPGASIKQQPIIPILKPVVAPTLKPIPTPNSHRHERRHSSSRRASVSKHDHRNTGGDGYRPPRGGDPRPRKASYDDRGMMAPPIGPPPRRRTAQDMAAAAPSPVTPAPVAEAGDRPARRGSMSDRPRRGSKSSDERLFVMEVKFNQPQPTVLETPTSATAPLPVLEQIREAFGNFHVGSTTEQEDEDEEAAAAASRFSADTSDTLSVYSNLLPPDDDNSDARSTYSSIIPSNPFDCDALPLGSPKPKLGEPRFSPDDMWRLHGQPSDARLSALPSPNRIREMTLDAVQNFPAAPAVPVPGEKSSRRPRPPNVKTSSMGPMPIQGARLPTTGGVSSSGATPNSSTFSISATSISSTWTDVSNADFHQALTPRPPVATMPTITDVPAMSATQPWLDDFDSLSSTPTFTQPPYMAELDAVELEVEPESPKTTRSTTTNATNARPKSPAGSSGTGTSAGSDESIISEKAAQILGITAGKDGHIFDKRRASDEARSGWSMISRDSGMGHSMANTSDISSISSSKDDISEQYNRSLLTWDTRHASYASSRTSMSSMFTSSNATLEAACVWKALKKSKKPDTDLLTQTLVSASYHPYSMFQLRQKYSELYATDLVKDIRAITSGWYRLALCRLVVGPHEAESQWLNKSDSSFFMDDKLVAEAIFGRSPDELKAIESHFERTTGQPLSQALEDMYLAHSYTNGSAFDSGGPTGMFGRACLRAIKTERQVETWHDVEMMTPDRRFEREAGLARHVDDLYKGERLESINKYLNQSLMLDLVLTKSDLYLFELCRKFYERHGKQLTDLVGVKDRSKMMVSSTFPINLVCLSLSLSLRV